MQQEEELINIMIYLKKNLDRWEFNWKSTMKWNL